MARYRKKRTPYGRYITILTVILAVLGLFALGIKFLDSSPELRLPKETTTVTPTI